jgi:hypothetical protein
MLRSIMFFKLCHFLENVEKCSEARQATDDDIYMTTALHK